MDRKTGAVKKTIIRNFEIPPKRTESRHNVIHNYSDPSIGSGTHSRSEGISQQPARKSAPLTSEMLEHGLKYKVPELYSTDRMKVQIDKLKSMKISRDVRAEDMTPRSKAVLNKEMTKKLNFPPDKPIFKNLVPINVNDSFLMTPEHKKPFRKKYVAKSNKDPVPELSDFLTPISPLKLSMQHKDKPLIQIRPNNSFYKTIYELHVNFHPDC